MEQLPSKRSKGCTIKKNLVSLCPLLSSLPFRRNKLSKYPLKICLSPCKREECPMITRKTLDLPYITSTNLLLTLIEESLILLFVISMKWWYPQWKLREHWRFLQGSKPYLKRLIKLKQRIVMIFFIVKSLTMIIDYNLYRNRNTMCNKQSCISTCQHFHFVVRKIKMAILP